MSQQMKSKTPKDQAFDCYSIEQISKGDLKLQQISNNIKIQPNLLTYPFNCIGLLKFTNPKTGMVLNGTSFLISSDLILTSAQNIYNSHEQCYYNSFQFLPPSLDPKEQQSIKIRQYRVDGEFVKGKGVRQNYKNCFGLLKLDRPVICDQYFKIKYNYSQDNGQINVYGYPKPQQRPRLYGKIAKIIKYSDQTCYYDSLLEIGHNGSPIFIKINRQILAIGMHLGFNDNNGVGMLFKKQNTVKLYQWQREMMISSLKMSIFQESNTNECEQQYSCYFENCELKNNQLQKKWTPLNVTWQLNQEQINKLIVESNKITRIQNSMFDDLHRQASSKQPLSKEMKSYIFFKIIQYGSSLPYDPIYFGISNEKHKKNVCSDGRSKGSLSYVSAPYNFSSGDSGIGSILLDGRQLAYGQEWFVKKGGQIKLQVDLIENSVTLSNGIKSLTFNLSSKWMNHTLYLFVSLASNKSCVSWNSNQKSIWY